jgi:hypothetical protein
MLSRLTDCIKFRYQIEGQIYAHVWCFFNLQDWAAGGVSVCLLRGLSNNGSDEEPRNLFGQTYDGAPLTSGLSGGCKLGSRKRILQQLLCTVVPIRGILSCNKHLLHPRSGFPSPILKISAIFHQSAKRTDVLTEGLKKRMLQSLHTTRDFESRIVSNVYEHRIRVFTYSDATCRNTL